MLLHKNKPLIFINKICNCICYNIGRIFICLCQSLKCCISIWYYSTLLVIGVCLITMIGVGIYIYLVVSNQKDYFMNIINYNTTFY